MVEGGPSLKGGRRGCVTIVVLNVYRAFDLLVLPVLGASA